MEQEENFSDDLQENLRMENEFLRIKLKAMYGEAFPISDSDEMSPEIENQFLKSMLTFEDEHDAIEYTTIYERLGRPVFKPAAGLTKGEIDTALKEITDLLEKNEIELSICNGPYPGDLIYRFITEELFKKVIGKKPVAGMTSTFIYEEFYPNHAAEIASRTKSFFDGWFSGKFSEYSTELSWHCVTAYGEQMTREDVAAKVNLFFDAFRSFREGKYSITASSFELHDDESRGMGFSEGLLEYDGMMENGEIMQYRGPYKLYLQLEENWWSIFYFVVPGFKW